MTGPIELIVLTLPSTEVSPQVVEALAEMVEHRAVVVLDLMFLARQQDGTLRVIDLDDELHELGLRPLIGQRRPLVSSHDLAVIGDGLAADSSALVAVVENSWADRIAETVAGGGGAVALHVRVPVDDAAAAIAAAAA